MVAVNAVGAVFDPQHGDASRRCQGRRAEQAWRPFAGVNTTIGVVATTRARSIAGGVQRLAMQAHDGLCADDSAGAHPVRRRHAVRAVAARRTRRSRPTRSLLAQAAVDVVVAAVLRAVRAAHGAARRSSGGWVTPAEQERSAPGRAPHARTGRPDARAGPDPDRQPAGRVLRGVRRPDRAYACADSATRSKCCLPSGMRRAHRQRIRG